MSAHRGNCASCESGLTAIIYKTRIYSAKSDVRDVADVPIIIGVIVMPLFVHSWSPYGPSGTIEAEDLDAACTAVHAIIDLLAMQVTARHLPPSNGDDPMMPWEGAVLVVESRVQRYGDNAQLRIAVYGVDQTSYFDKMRAHLTKVASA